MCVLRDYFGAIIGQLLNHYPFSMVKFAKDFFKFSPGNLLISSISWPSLELLAVIVFEIS